MRFRLCHAEVGASVPQEDFCFGEVVIPIAAIWEGAQHGNSCGSSSAFPLKLSRAASDLQKTGAAHPALFLRINPITSPTDSSEEKCTEKCEIETDAARLSQLDELKQLYAELARRTVGSGPAELHPADLAVISQPISN